MFHTIPSKILDRMEYLEKIDARDRIDKTTRLKRLRQIPRETGKFLALWAANVPQGEYIEIGTSAGYSTLWISLACRELGRHITTFEVLEEKVNMAKETFNLTNSDDFITLIHGDARKYLHNYKNISFCFLDAEKEVYDQCYDLIIPNMVKGGILIADNAINHKETLQPMIDKALNDERVDSLIVTQGNGELLCRKL